MEREAGGRKWRAREGGETEEYVGMIGVREDESRRGERRGCGVRREARCRQKSLCA